MAVVSFAPHLRSEFALHRFDLVGDDAPSVTLLAQSELTDHAVTILGGALLARGKHAGQMGFRATIESPGSEQVVIIVDDAGPRLERSDATTGPDVSCDPAARLLLLWGRNPGDPRRIQASGDPQTLGTLRSLLAGY